VAVVVDASLVAALASRDVRAGAVEQRFRDWLDAGEELHAPSLLPYEVANALTRLVVAGRLPSVRLAEAWSHVERLPLQLHPLQSGPSVIAIALRLHRQTSYDAAYIFLAQQLGGELWTLDGPLARNASGLGFPVRLVA
jgi:predicted nucleic acid-binding protein